MWYVGGIPVVERNHSMVTALFFFTALGFLLVGLRLFTRIVLVRNLGVDDCLMVAALIGSILYLSAVFQQIRFGLGDAVDLGSLRGFLISLYATVICYNFTQLAVKFSILTQYKRIFETRSAGKLFTGLLIYLGAYAAFCIGSSIFTCVPVAKYWDDNIPGGCINRSNLHYGIAAVNIINDFLLLCIPYPFLKRLNITRRAKYVLIGVFACGGVACIIAIIRLQSLVVNNSAPIDQQPIQGVDIALWSGLEINIAISCASVPQLKAMFVKVIPKLTTYYSSSNGYGNGASERGTGARGTQPHRSQTGKNASATATADKENSNGRTKGGIMVERAFEMQSIPVPDDGSEQNLVVNGWNADCYAKEDLNQPAGGRSSPV